MTLVLTPLGAGGLRLTGTLAVIPSPPSPGEDGGVVGTGDGAEEESGVLVRGVWLELVLGGLGVEGWDGVVERGAVEDGGDDRGLGAGAVDRVVVGGVDDRSELVSVELRAEAV